MVEIVHWNPVRRRVPGWRGLLTRRRPVDNFGDLLGPLITRELVTRAGGRPEDGADRRLLTVGSILAMARRGDVVWGTGVNGKNLHHDYDVAGADFRAVRGPLTRDFATARGATVPAVYGDPGLLVGQLWTREEVAGDRPRTSHLVVPNFHDFGRTPVPGPELWPRSPLHECLAAIAASDLVVGSSLHGVVVADAFGVPARFVRSDVEPDVKYRDYLAGTGRPDVEIADSVEDALRRGPHPPPRWDPVPLLEAFPAELWGLGSVVAAVAPRDRSTTGETPTQQGAWTWPGTGQAPGVEQGAESHGTS